MDGKIFGKWKVLRFSHINRFIFYLCRCECGTKRAVRAVNLKNGSSKSCGCTSAPNSAKSRKKKFDIYIGKTYHNLTITSLVYSQNRTMFQCLCICGKYNTLPPNVVIKGKQFYCGKKCVYRKIKSRINNRFSSYKKNAREKNREFSLTIENFAKIVSKPCKYCGFADKLSGIDRKNNKLGYIKSNVVPCCTKCNQAKHIMSEYVFKQWVNRLVKFNNFKTEIEVV